MKDIQERTACAIGNANCVCQLASHWASLQHKAKRGRTKIDDLEVDAEKSGRAIQRSLEFGIDLEGKEEF